MKYYLPNVVFVSLYVKKEKKGSGLLQTQATYKTGIY
jgi:hypothetical protein